MNWRIYRLPGSRETWHIDAGQCSNVINVRGYHCYCSSRSVDIGGMNVPRAWIEVCGEGSELHIVDGIAIFDVSVEELMHAANTALSKIDAKDA